MDNQQYYCFRFYVTHACNSRCVFCDTYRNPEYGRIRPLKQESAERLIDQMYACGCRYVDFTGGEPTMNKALPALLAHAKTLGIKTEVTTNGVAGICDASRACARLADKFNISLDTIRRDKYLKIRGVDALDTVKSVIEDTAELRREARLSAPKLMTVVSEDNLDELDDLIRFAQERAVDIYFNPVFSYADGMKPAEALPFIRPLTERVFMRRAVVMLHFLEFYRDAAHGERLHCSANRQTVTVAADGSVMVPCYHARERERLTWKGSLQEVLDSAEFRYYQENCGSFPDCEICAVTPYFGIGFNYRLDKYFLLQSFSEKLAHLKRDYLNYLRLSGGREALLAHLDELLAIVRSLRLPRAPNESGLYRIRKAGDLYDTDVYRRPLTEKQVWADQRAKDCWDLPNVPHAYFDSICRSAYDEAFKRIREGNPDPALMEVFEYAEEFMVRWWKLYITVHMNVSICCDVKAETAWIESYIKSIGALNLSQEIQKPPILNFYAGM